MTDFTTLPIEDLYESVLQSDLSAVATSAVTVKAITGTLTGGDTCYMGIDYDKPSKYELVEISVISGQNVTIINRDIQNKAGGTSGTGKTHAAGAKVIITHSYKVFEDIQTAIASKANSASPTLSNLVVTGFIDLPTYANAAARDIAIPTPQTGYVVVLLSDGSSNRAFSVYNDTTWGSIAAPLIDVTVNGYLDVISGYAKLPVYATTLTRDAAIVTPAAGMIVYVANLTTMTIYDGAAWQPLDLGTITPLASQILAGKVELATDAEALARTNTSGGNPLVVQPSQLDLANSITATAEMDLVAGDPVGVATFVSDSSFVMSKAFLEAGTLAMTGSVTTLVGSIKLSDTRIFLLYLLSGSVLTGAVATINTATNVITSIGTPVTFATGGFVDSDRSVDICLLDTDKVAVTYIYTATNTVVRVRPATISVAVITLGAEQTLITLAGAGSGPLKIAEIDTNKAVVYARASVHTNSRITAFSVSGTTITAGAGIASTTNVASVNDITKIDTNKFILVMSSGTIGYALVGTVATVTITLGAEQTFTTGGTSINETALTALITTDRVLQSYRASGSASADTLVVLSISGTTVTANTPLSLPTAVMTSGTFGKLSATSIYYLNASGLVCEVTVTGVTLTTTIRSSFGDLLSSIQPRNNLVISGRLVTFLETSDVLFMRRTGMAMTFIGTVNATVSRNATATITLKSVKMPINVALLGGEYYSMTVSTFSSFNTQLGVPTLATATGSSNPTRKAVNSTIIALKSDTIVAI